MATKNGTISDTPDPSSADAPATDTSAPVDSQTSGEPGNVTSDDTGAITATPSSGDTAPEPALPLDAASDPLPSSDDTTVSIDTIATSDSDAFDELPKGAHLVDESNDSAGSSGNLHRPRIVAAFDDEHVGKGGSYVVGDDGVRRPAYERFLLPNPDDLEGDQITKFRRIM